jgi:geranylgeranyl diphosphate synthase type II
MIQENPADKVQQMLNIFKECNVYAWANELKEKYYQIALKHLDDIAVTSLRKKALIELAEFLIQREN